MKKLFTIILLGLSFATFAYDYKLENVTVTDGDTVKATVIMGLNVALYKQSIRLLGFDTPETLHYKSKLELRAGLLVTLYVQKLRDAAKNFEIKGAKWDKYGNRIAGYMYLDGEELGQILIPLKFAREYHGEKKKPWTTEELQYIVDKLAPEFEPKKKTISNAPSVPSIRTILAGQVSFSPSTMMK